MLVLHWCLVCHMWLLLLVCVLAGACGFDFRSAFVDYGLVFCVGGGVATVECVVECSTEGFSRALKYGVSMSLCEWLSGLKDLRGYLLPPL